MPLSIDGNSVAADGESGVIDPTGSERRVLLLRLAPEFPTETSAWLEHWYQPETVMTSMRAVERVQAERYGLILIYLCPYTVVEAFEALRVMRGLTSSPILLATADVVRASDRTRAIKLGAGDFLSGPLHTAELASRVEKAIIAGPPPHLPTIAPPLTPAQHWPVVGQNSSDSVPFVALIRRRLDHPSESPFTLMRVSVSGPPEACARVGEVIRQEIRAESGDLTGAVTGGYGVLLQDTEVAYAGRFLERLHAGLVSTDVWIRAETLSSLLDAQRIREWLAPA